MRRPCRALLAAVLLALVLERPAGAQVQYRPSPANLLPSQTQAAAAPTSAPGAPAPTYAPYPAYGAYTGYPVRQGPTACYLHRVADANAARGPHHIQGN